MSREKPSYEELARRCRLAEARLEALSGDPSDNPCCHLFQNSHAVMLIIEPDTGEIVDANLAAADYYGWSRQNLMRMNIADINTLSPTAIHEEMQVARTANRRYFHFKHRRADGSIRDVEVYSGPVAVDGRTLLHSIIHDITARREAERQLRRRTSELNTLFKLNEIVDRKGITIDGILQQAADLLPAVWPEREHAVARIRWGDRVYETGDYSRCKTILSEELRVLDERVGTVEVGCRFDHGDDATCAFPAEAPALIAALAERLGRVIERKEAEAALRENEENYRFLVENSNDIIWVFDLASMTYRYCSASVERILGYSPKEAIGISLDDLFSSATKARITESFGRVLSGAAHSDRVVMEAPHRHRNGAIVWMEISAVLKRDAAGRPAAFSGVSRDITERRKTEERLRDSESRHRVIFEKSPLGMIRFWPDGTILDCNQPFVDLMGSSREKLIGFNTARQSTPEMRRTIKKALAGETAVYENEYTSITGGKSTFLRVVFNPVNAGQSPTEVIATLEEITERKRTERKLKESEQKFSAAFMSSPAILVVSTVEEGRYVEVSDAFTQYTGYGREELIGKTSVEIGLWAFPTARPELLERFKRDGVVKNAEIRIRTKTGETRTGLLSTQKITVEGDAHFLSQIFDITEQRKAEEKLLKSEARLRHLLTVSPTVIFSCEPRGKFEATFVSDNVTRLSGYTPKQFTDGSDFWRSHIHPEDKRRIIDGFSRIFETGRHRHEYRFLHTDGRYHWMLDELRVVYGRDGNPVEVVGSWTDITERKQMEQDLIAARKAAEAASRAKSDFIAHMSHELRTPLNTILGYVQLLMLDETFTGHHRNAVVTIGKSGEHLLTLINDILDMARSEAGKLGFIHAMVDIRRLISNVADMLRPRAKQKHIDLVENIDPAIPRFVICDERRLRQVLLNLISNAIKFTDRGWVAITVRPAGPRIAFCISDTGIGIPAENHTAIFEPFRQLAGVSAATEGTGLGLTICRELVRAMGGEIRVESTPDRGSVFRFDLELPEHGSRIQVRKQGAEPPDEPAEAARPSSPLTPPPAEDAAALLTLARMGDLGAICDYIETLRRSKPETAAFCRRIEQCAKEMDMTEIRKTIQRFIKVAP